MKIHLALLLSDWIIYSLLLSLIALIFYMKKKPHWRDPLKQLCHQKLAMISLVILGFYIVIGLLDSIHFEVIKKNNSGYELSETKSLLDLLVSPLGEQDELTYSAPFATHLHNLSLITLPNGKEARGFSRLEYGGIHLLKEQDQHRDIMNRVLYGLSIAMMSYAIICVVLIWIYARKSRLNFRLLFHEIIANKTNVPWRAIGITFFILWALTCSIAMLATHYHIFGTDKVGQDVFYQSIKSIRIGLIIGTLTTLLMLPLALFLGILAGFYGKWIDDIIQYLYTTLSAIPGVLLIAASILMLQVYISNHPELFPSLIQRADARLLAFCFILGITGWASLCRLLRGETLKLREQEYVRAARAMGAGSFRIIIRHIVPNVMHIVLITLVLDFSGLVLAEAVLSYIGIGIDPTTMSWGNMINSSRLELAREPMVWWPLTAALVFMFGLVLAANLLADAVRDALDPRLHRRQHD